MVGCSPVSCRDRRSSLDRWNEMWETVVILSGRGLVGGQRFGATCPIDLGVWSRLSLVPRRRLRSQGSPCMAGPSRSLPFRAGSSAKVPALPRPGLIRRPSSAPSLARLSSWKNGRVRVRGAASAHLELAQVTSVPLTSSLFFFYFSLFNVFCCFFLPCLFFLLHLKRYLDPNEKEKKNSLVASGNLFPQVAGR